MAQLERFNHGGHHDEHTLPVLMRAALADLQFERIHPFLDGNGRQGRLLIVLMLIETGVLQQPMLYVSLFFKQHGSHYFELLDRFRQQGDWEAWLAFFLEGLGRSGPSVRMGYGGGLAQAAAHQHQAAHGVERPQLAHRQQGDRNLGGSRHRPGDHRRTAQSAARLRRLPGGPQRGHGVALNGIELKRSVSAGISTNHSDRTNKRHSPLF